MSATLSQSEAANHPDRGSVGLRVDLAGGGGGSHLLHDVGVEQTIWHTRWAMRHGDLAGGPVVVLAGFDGAGAEICRATIDPALSQVTVDLATEQNLAGSLHGDIVWHTVEIGVDTISGEASLWIDGVQCDSVSGSFGSLVVRSFWFGAPLKHVDAVGTIDLDEWIIAEDHIGLIRVEPGSPYADDPARWLVIYNTAVGGSAAFAQAYRDARGVPYANLLGLDLPTGETITAAQFADLNNAIEQYLADNDLADTVMGVLTGYGVPGYADFGTSESWAIDDLLHVPGSTSGVAFNPNAADAIPSRPTRAVLGTHRLTARLDAADWATALALLDRATALMQQSPGDGLDAAIYLDPFAGSGPLFATPTQRMVDWSQSLDRQRLRLPMYWSGPLDSTTPQQFDQIQSDGFFWGWAQAQPTTGFFASPAGRRMVCAQLTVDDAAATTARGAVNNWIVTPLAGGYAAATAMSRASSASTVPHVRPFFEALRQGWTLAEAMYLAKPVLRDGLQLVGDPLLRVALPRAGWDVFGPMVMLEQLDPDQPAASLRADETSLASASGEGFYVVRAVDDEGRTEHGLSAASMSSVVLAPVWPRHADWPVRVRGGEVEAVLAWDRTLAAAGVARIELLDDQDGVLAEVSMRPFVRWVKQTVSMPAGVARYRWRVTSFEDQTWASPLSAIVSPHAPLPAALRMFEEADA